MSRRILVVTQERLLTRGVKRSLVSAGCEVSSCPVDALDEKIESTDMFIVDADNEFEDVSTLLSRLSKERPESPVLMVSRDLRKSGFLSRALECGLSNVIARHGGVAASQHHIDETELIATVDKLLTRDIFGMEKYLPSQAIAVHTKTLTHSDERHEALKDLEGFLEAIDCYTNIQPMAVAAADELLMNAIFSAPRDARGEPKYESRDRGDSFALEPREEIEFRYACDGRNLFISVGDQFGSLGRQSIVKYLSFGADEKGEVEYKAGGAGLGLYMVVRSITQLVFNIQRDKRTEVIASLYIRGGRRAFRRSGQSLNIFMLD